MTASSQSSVTPIQSSSEPPSVIVPDMDLFAKRALRFEQLAVGHSLGDWLGFLATLTRAQHQVLQTLPVLPLPGTAEREQAHAFRMPLVPAQSWPRDPAWHGVLHQIIEAVMPAAPQLARDDLTRLSNLPSRQLEVLAERVMRAELAGEDGALLPYVGAALQVVWTALAARLGSSIGAIDVPGVCPCCGYLPQASVVKTVSAGDQSVANLRYLHCAMCNTEWNLVRVKCATCDANDSISYRQLEGPGVTQPGAVRAETCEHCKTYLKIIYQEQGGVDPVADDLATLALDILVDQAGYARAGPNLLLVPGLN
jgi:FdhE protein